MKTLFISLAVISSSLLIHSFYFNPVPQQLHSRTHILAHRASSSLWIQNSRNAVQKTTQLFTKDSSVFHGLEVDIVLTKDNIPVLSHDPWIHQSLCVRKNGQMLQKVFIKDITFSELQSQYLCGGITDNEFPNAALKEETILGFSEFLAIVKTMPTMIVYLDLKIQPPLTKTANDYAQAIFNPLQTANINNPLYIEGPDSQSIAALNRYIKHPFISVQSYPAFLVGENWWLKGAIYGLIAYLNPKHPLEQAKTAQAVASPLLISHHKMSNYLNSAQKQFIVFSSATDKNIQQGCQAKATIFITDYPHLGPCITNHPPSSLSQ